MLKGPSQGSATGAAMCAWAQSLKYFLPRLCIHCCAPAGASKRCQILNVSLAMLPQQSSHAIASTASMQWPAEQSRNGQYSKHATASTATMQWP
eukprot:scaffold62693_cov22-Tisochrysis_lutea.AAC.3